MTRQTELTLKRLFDLALSWLAISITFLPLLFISILIKMSSKESILFNQPRPGKDGKIFRLHKFRTMKDLKDDQGNMAPDEKRITKIGGLLRQSSLDELPELFNVLRGEMSIVGPRPLLVRYLDRYSAEQARRHAVKPGLTGWAQVNGRNATTWEERFNYDLWYVDNWSLWLDFRIISMTILKVLRGEGIHQPGHATMQEFKGENGSAGLAEKQHP